MATPSIESEYTETVGQETPQKANGILWSDYLNRKENQQLKTEVASLQAMVTKRGLFLQPKKWSWVFGK